MSADKPATNTIILDFVVEADEEEQLPTQNALQALFSDGCLDEISDDYRITYVGTPPQPATGTMVEALTAIASETTDLTPPFKALSRLAMQDVARAALADTGGKPPQPSVQRMIQQELDNRRRRR